jgi:hypothetical protein
MWRQSNDDCLTHRLNMELDLQSLFGVLVYSCSHWLRPRNSPSSPEFWLITRALLVSQDRRKSLCNPLASHFTEPLQVCTDCTVVSTCLHRVHCNENPIYVFLFWE